MSRIVKFWYALLVTGLLYIPTMVTAQTVSAPAYSGTGNYTVNWSGPLGCVNEGEPEYYCYIIVESKNFSEIATYWDGSSRTLVGKTTGYYRYEYYEAYVVGGSIVGWGSYGGVTVLVALPNSDVDGDGVQDQADAFPTNASEWVDTDGDGTGNNSDTDDDGDGIPDTWENTHGLNSLTYDSNLDYDHDGSTNLQEYQANTNPSNLLSCSTGCLFTTPPNPAHIDFPAVDTTSDAVGAIPGNINVNNGGAAEYTFPIFTPPGTAGLTPKLALQYRSNGGYGILGEGWSFGALSAISRCPQTPTQDGQGLILNLSLTDRFCLDGERLVLKNTSDTYGASGTEYRTETDSQQKIMLYGNPNSGTSYFVVWRKDGTISKYGDSDDSRAKTRFWGSGPFVPYMWARTSIEDALSYNTAWNNKIVYTYVNMTATGTFPYASNTPEPLMISRIEYGGGNMGYHSRIDFTYQDRPDVREFWIFSQHKFRERKRLSSIQVMGKSPTTGVYGELRTYNLSYVDVSGRRNKTSKLASISECRGSVCLPPTQFTWSDTGSDFQLTPSSNVTGFSNFPFAVQDIKKFSPADFNSDGKTDLVWLEADGGSYRFRVSLSDGATLTASGIQSSATHAVDAWTVYDFNQDGCPDILFTIEGALNLYANNRVSGVCTLAGTSVVLVSNLDVHQPASADANRARSDEPKGIFADVNADGLLDVMYQSSIFYLVEDPLQINGPYKYASPNPPWSSNNKWENLFNLAQTYIPIYAQGYIYPGTPEYFDLDSAEFPGDFNEDGRPDLVLRLIYNDSGTTFPGDYVVLTQRTDGTFDYFGFYGDADNPAAGGVKVADVNQNGLPDLVFKGLSDSRVRVARGKGRQLDISLAWYPESTHLLLPDGDFELADINQDGFLDLVYRNTVAGDDEIKALIYTKGQYGTSDHVYVTLANVVGDDKGNHIFLDLNGDGILDFVDLASKAYLGNTASSTNWNKLTKITNGLGEEINISYKQLTDPSVYTREYDAADIDSCYTVQSVTRCYPVFDVSAPATVVSSISRSAPIEGSVNNLSTTSYHYQGLKVQPGGRGSFGFHKMTVTDNQTGNSVVNTFRQDFPFIGLLASTQTYVGGQGTPLSETVNTYAKLSHINGAVNPPHFVAMTQSVTTQRIAESSPTASSPALTVNGVLTTTTTSLSNFDSYGNPGTTIVSVTGDGNTHTTTTTSTYSNNATTWIIGKLTQSIATRQQGSSTITRKTDFTYDAYGRLLTEVREPQGDVAVKLTTTYEYDGFGNPNKIIETSAAGTRYSRMVYDATGRFVDKTYNGLEQLLSEVTQRDVYGNPEVIRSLNGVETYARFGTFGRQYFAASNDGMSATTLYRACTAVACPTGAAFRVQTTGVDGSFKNTYMDKLGREVRSEIKSFSGTLSLVDTQYDASGRVKKVSVPYFSGGTAYWTTTDYDHLNRVIKVTDAQDYISTNVFSRYTNGATVGVQQLSTNQLSQTKTTITNGLGQSIRVVDSLNGYINYAYDAAGSLTQLNANGVLSDIEYDVLGRRTSLDDPDQGDWDYLYNAFGEMTDQQDASGRLTHIDFDALGRMTQRRDYASGMVLEADARWTYGTTAAARNVGQVIQEQDLVSDYIKVYAYDTKGRLSQTVTSLGTNGSDGDYAEYQTYDQYGRKFQTIDATAKGVQHIYNANGYLEKLVEASNTSKIYHQITQTNARGQVTGEQMMGGAFQMTRGYSAQTGLASTILATSSQYTATPSGATLLDISLDFDAVGNLSNRSRQVKATSSLSAHTLDETFSYDQLNRLTQIAATGHATQSLTYDIAGNILTKTGISGTYGYGANGAGPHAVTSAGGATYTYDAIGNMLTGDGRTAIYNAFRKPTSLTKGSNTTTFAYGPDRSHYKRVDNNGINVTTTITVGSVEFIRVDANAVTSKRYIGGVAVITDSTATGHEEHVLLTDHLGSTVAIAKHTALDLQQMDYDAFGKRRNLWDLTELAQADKAMLNGLTTKGFTGHEMVDGVGVIHMKGRVYDPRLGRFLSADPHITELSNTQNMNRYSYVYNNPLTLIDPNGFDATPQEGCQWELDYNGSIIGMTCDSSYTEVITVTGDRSSYDPVPDFGIFYGSFGFEEVNFQQEQGDPFGNHGGVAPEAQAETNILGRDPDYAKSMLRTEAIDDSEAQDIVEAMIDIKRELRKLAVEDLQKFFGVKGVEEAMILADALDYKLESIGVQALTVVVANQIVSDIQWKMLGNAAGAINDRAVDVIDLIGQGFTIYDGYNMSTIENDGYGISCRRNQCVLFTPEGGIAMDPIL